MRVAVTRPMAFSAATLASAAMALMAGLGTAAPAKASTTVGSIFACYACQNTGDTAIDTVLAAHSDVAYDGILFEFNNTSGSAITGATFNVNTGAYSDSYALPTIAANSSLIYLPGLQSDGGIHPAGSVFSDPGYTMDLSDGQGGISDSSIFFFLGSQGALAVTSGSFTPGDFVLPWRSPTGGSTTFAGQGPSGDGGCNNCFYGQVGTLTIPNVKPGVPEPATWGLMILGFGGAGAALRRRRAQPRVLGA